MATLPKSPQENQFTVADIPKDNILEIKEIIKNPIFNEYYIKIKELITEYRKDTIYHILIPSLLAISHHALINEGFLNNKHEINYKIKFNARLLAVANHLTEDSVNQHLEWMKLNTYTFKYKEKNMNRIEYTGQIQSLLEDLTWQNEYINGWNKLVRYFLLGIMMYGYYQNDLSKSIKKNKKAKQQKSNFLNELNKAVSKCTNSIMEESKTSTTINSALEIIKMDNESADSKLTKEELIKKLKGHLKFSYYLFYFVRMFGYVSLIASVSPDLADKLLKSINPKNLNEINNSFNDLKEIDLGKDLIAKNAEYGNIICRTVIECSQTMKIHNDKLKEGLEELIDRYAFNTYSNIIFEEININNENNYRSEFNAISDDDDISMDEDEKNKIMDKLNEDIQDLKRKSSIEAFNTESQIIDDIKKNEMRSHIKTIRNALDENIYNELIKKSSEILH
uniref:Uncharacterized protein n=1 Tax=Rhizophagus irregularis (strain DAOM 181602 / DAOM 197198 / MUCL 43194) TaxID=747089 RepID=U9UQA5_RHIID